jgi:hypothetical protein
MVSLLGLSGNEVHRKIAEDKNQIINKNVKKYEIAFNSRK